nr:hypothetical protein L204_05078 [Cryptococcus depauperatus CBS 7855]
MSFPWERGPTPDPKLELDGNLSASSTGQQNASAPVRSECPHCDKTATYYCAAAGGSHANSEMSWRESLLRMHSDMLLNKFDEFTAQKAAEDAAKAAAESTTTLDPRTDRSYGSDPASNVSAVNRWPRDIHLEKQRKRDGSTSGRRR